jgi:LPPG:FO 2-phospho-L-lactate transferase
VTDTILRQKERGLKVIAVSPIVGGQALKGPLKKMFNELGVESSALSVAQHYINLIDWFIMDEIDKDLMEAVKSLKVIPICLNTIMKSIHDRERLAKEIITHLMV